VVRLHCGAWYDPADLDDAGPGPLCAHGNANVLTYDRGTSKLGQAPSCGTLMVQIERWDGAAPPVNAFVPPATVQEPAR
jgi:biotin/methionine sulfoxide reductase